MFVKHHSKLSIMLITAIFLAGALALPNTLFAAKERATADYHSEMSGKKFVYLQVETVNGGIEIIGGDSEEIIIDAEFMVNGPDEDVCEKLVQEIKVDISEKGDKLYIEADTPKKFRYTSQVSFSISVPSRYEISCESTNGGVNVENIQSGLKIETTNGGIDCRNIGKYIDVETVNGAVNLMEIGGNASAETVNGSIVADFTKNAPSKISMEAVNGRISVEFMSIVDAQINAETVNGSLEIAGQRVKKKGLIGKSFNGKFGSGKGDYNFETVNGSIEIDIPNAE